MASTRTLISNGVVLSMDSEIGDLDRGDVLIEDSKIVAVAPGIDAEDCERIDATDCIVMPGFVDTHRHTWQAPVRNIAADWNLFHYLAGLHTGLSRHFRPQDTYAGNLIGTIEALDSGITTLLDWSHNLNSPEHTNAAVQGLKDSGARAIFAHGGGAPEWQTLPNPNAHPEDARRVREELFSSNDALVTMALALRGPQFTDPEATLHDWRLADELDLRITVHVGDGELGKTRPIEWLRAQNLLNDRTTYVHCNTLGDDELAMIADSGGSASVAAIVEMQMGHGWPATGRLLEAGIRPSLSIDVCSAIGGDMFSPMRTTLVTQRAMDNADAEERGISLSGGDPLKVSCRDVLEFATIEGARACGLERRTGSLTPGKDADIVLIRTDNAAMTPINHPYGAVVYNAHPGLVDTVLVAGTPVKRGGRLTVDVARARRLAEETKEHLIAATQNDDRISDRSFDGQWLPRTNVPV
jgi:5-methylthioadenosine/S-adenosylhomocysteine deaminase